MKAGIVAAAMGGTVAVVEGLLLIALGSLAGLAKNPEGEAAMTDGYVSLALGAIVLTAVFAARRWPFLLAPLPRRSPLSGFSSRTRCGSSLLRSCSPRRRSGSSRSGEIGDSRIERRILCSHLRFRDYVLGQNVRMRECAGIRLERKSQRDSLKLTISPSGSHRRLTVGLEADPEPCRAATIAANRFAALIASYWSRDARLGQSSRMQGERVSEEAAHAASSAPAMIDTAEDYSIGISKRAMMPGSPPLASSSGWGSRVATHAYPCSG